MTDAARITPRTHEIFFITVVRPPFLSALFTARGAPPPRALARDSRFGSRIAHPGSRQVQSMNSTARTDRRSTSVGDAIRYSNGPEPAPGNKNATMRRKPLFDLAQPRTLSDVVLCTPLPPAIHARHTAHALYAKRREHQTRC